MANSRSRDELAKRLAAKQAEKDRYVRLYAQGQVTEGELDVYLTDLKDQTDNLRLLLGSVEAELSQQQKQAELADSTELGSTRYASAWRRSKKTRRKRSTSAGSSLGSSWPTLQSARALKTVRSGSR